MTPFCVIWSAAVDGADHTGEMLAIMKNEGVLICQKNLPK